MRIVFAGTPAFAVPTLKALHASRHELAAVYTQPDRPSGRGHKLRPSSVKQAALERGLKVVQVEDFKSTQAVDELRAFGAEAMVVVAYGLLLPPPVLEIFPSACWNLHASILPRWRGAAPIARAIEAGDSYTAVAVMKMERGLDTGPILSQTEVAIGPDDNAERLQTRLAVLGAELMVVAMDQLSELSGQPLALEAALRVQSSDGITYASKLSKAEALLDFGESAMVLERRMRAFDPVPGCFTWVHKAQSGAAPTLLKCWRARVHDMDQGANTHDASAVPYGRVVGFGEAGPIIACAGSCIELVEVQPAGGVRLAAMPWARQFGLKAGDLFGNEALGIDHQAP